ncbi:hypothetical protein VNO78_25629 [Psophocarpus tetragonolobus]|uniref:Uncharacterized protein n=1 Tax=Psophocarpus tetragonolobus TaxID=3891 RepID=A0AAN9S849_PSOTE
MVFPKLAITIALVLVLFFFICESEGASYSSASHNVNHGDDINPPNSYQKVNLSVYYDSLCQSCAKFIIQDLRNIFDSNLISIVNLQLVPWAKAYLINNSISCQDYENFAHYVCKAYRGAAVPGVCNPPLK